MEQVLSLSPAKSIVPLDDPPDLIGDIISGILTPFWDFIKNVFKGIISFLKTIWDTLVTAISWLWDKIKAVYYAVISTITAELTKGSPVDPETSLTRATTLMALTGGIVGYLGITISIANTQVMASGLKLDPLDRLLGRLISPELITGAFLGVLVGASIRTPLSYWANRFYRPHLPDPRTAYSMYVKSIITEAEYRRLMAYTGGFSESYIDKLTKEYTFTPTAMNLIRLADYVQLPPLWVAKKLRDLGMDEWDLTYFQQAIVNRPIRDDALAVVSEVYSDYVYGWSPIETYRANIIKISGFFPLSTIENELREMKAVWYRSRLLKLQRQDIYVLEYQKDLIDVDTLRANLIALGLAEENVNLIIDYELVKKGIMP